MSQKKQRNVPQHEHENELADIVENLLSKYPFLKSDQRRGELVPSTKDEGAADQALRKLKERLSAE